MSDQTTSKLSGLLFSLLFFVLVMVSGFVASRGQMARSVDVTGSSQTGTVRGSGRFDFSQLSNPWLNPVGAILAMVRLRSRSDSDVFTSLPGDFKPINLNPADFIKLIVINTDPRERVSCRSELKGYEFFVLFADDTSTLESACGQGGDQYDYALEIIAYLNYSRGTPLFEREQLIDVKIISGDILSILKSLVYSI